MILKNVWQCLKTSYMTPWTPWEIHGAHPSFTQRNDESCPSWDRPSNPFPHYSVLKKRERTCTIFSIYLIESLTLLASCPGLKQQMHVSRRLQCADDKCTLAHELENLQNTATTSHEIISTFKNQGPVQTTTGISTTTCSQNHHKLTDLEEFSAISIP